MRTDRREPAIRLAGRAHSAAERPDAARTLLLDLDGTLAPIAVHPALARIAEPHRRAIRALRSAGWRVAVVSGRPRHEAVALVGIPDLPVFGSHGLEGPSERDLAQVDPPVLRRLGDVERLARQLSREFPAVLIERKAGSVACGDRALAPAARTRWRQRLASSLATLDLAGLEVLRGRCVVEVRSPRATKARVLATLGVLPLRTKPDESLVALGDDRTDEDLFLAIAGVGLGVLVGPPRRTHARARLASPAAVGRFLEALADFCSTQEEAR
ncbi:MAG: trehalose-phosphatase [Acidobacteria bacterium]|jgi:trehalose 6-phosphate phosphatase|nr:trehalose-phosphatase [Acidobacteriota bacterium]